MDTTIVASIGKEATTFIEENSVKRPKNKT